jgi:signal transduction histidine kinase
VDACETLRWQRQLGARVTTAMGFLGTMEPMNGLRLRRTGPPARPRTYLLLGLVFGVLWAPIVSTFLGSILGRQFVPTTIASIVVAQLLLRPIGRVERSLVVSFLGQDVPAPQPLRYERSVGSRFSRVVNGFRRVVASFKDGHSWRVLAWILIRMFIGPLGFVAVVGRFVIPALLVLLPVAVVVDSLSDTIAIGFAGKNWLLLAPLGLVVSPVLRRCTGALVGLHRRLAVWALGPGRDEIEAALARAAQAEEQVRIDQELHDSIGHMLSMIVVQAGAGAHVFDRDPTFAHRALGTIEQRGRAALGELDRIISHFKGVQGGADKHAPLPDAQSLPALIAGAREAGIDVAARIRIGELSAPLGRGVYRIVQEALTNAAKHAPGSAVRVDVASDGEAVAVSVVNDLNGAVPTADPASGRGLASIRDRATLLGGQATAGPAADPTRPDEFAVNAVLPLAALLPDGATTRCALSPDCACLGCTIRRRVLR